MINKNLLEYIKVLSIKDKKTLLEKNCKLTEEVGELAKVVLPYSNSFATNHRFVDKQDILEEIADSMLVLLSMLYDEKLNLSVEELESLMQQKANKWAELQNGELDLKYPIPYEIHITVDAQNINIEQFKKACQNIEVKPIVLDLENENKLIKDVMTSSVFMGNNSEAIREVERISNELKAFGFNVVREKVETVPWHPAAPSRKNNNNVMPQNCYFECHFGINLKEAKEKQILLLCITYLKSEFGLDVHLSNNFFKKNLDGSFKIMATYRSYKDQYEQFKNQVDLLEKELKSYNNNGFMIDKPIIEFSVYDTKVSHDKEWLTKNGK
jgi:NTP pyrophosphatase (non-canonical NTP hydrolase)